MAVRSNNSPQLTGCTDLARQLVPLLTHSDELVRWALNGRTEDYVLDNALHVAVLGAKVGMRLQYSQQNLERPVLAGLLDDIGMWTLPVSLVERREALPEEERDIIPDSAVDGRSGRGAMGVRRGLDGQHGVVSWPMCGLTGIIRLSQVPVQLRRNRQPR